MNSQKRIRVLVVDDSAIVRKLLMESLSAEPDIEVVGTAPDPFIARDKILALEPDVVTLDIEMPRMDGVTFLRKLMHHHPMPVIIISSLGLASSQAAISALEAGAVDVLAKPGGPQSVGELRLILPSRIRAAAAAVLKKTGPSKLNPAGTGAKPALPRTFGGTASLAVVAIGASTGGTEAITKVLTQLPAACPPIVITQHIPAVFSRSFANRLNDLCALRVREAEDGEPLEAGHALVAPGNFHMLLKKTAEGYRVEVKDGPRVCYQRPAVDVLFHSVAQCAGVNAVGALLTGMGSDGAQGLLAMKRAGGRTIAQDEASCVVFGMPREAIKLGAADQILTLSDIPAAIMAQSRSTPAAFAPAFSSIRSSAA